MLTTLASCPDICSHSAAEHLVWLMIVTLRKNEDNIDELVMLMVTFSCTLSTRRWVSSSCCAVSRHCSAGHRDPVTLVSRYVDMGMRRYVDM